MNPSIAYYDDTPCGRIGVRAGFPIDQSVTEVCRLEAVDLPEVEMAATAVHRGDMATADVDTVAPMFDWMRVNGFRTTEYSRGHDLACPEEPAQWRAEMQFQIEAVSDSRAAKSRRSVAVQRLERGPGHFGVGCLETKAG